MRPMTAMTRVIGVTRSVHRSVWILREAMLWCSLLWCSLLALPLSCQSVPAVSVEEPIAPRDYLAAAAIPLGVGDEPVQVVPLGLRIDPAPSNLIDGTWWITLDLAIEGPTDRARSIANCLKHQFYGRGPSLVRITTTANGDVVKMDDALYRARADDFVQFDPSFAFEQVSGPDRTLAFHPFPLALLRAPYGGDYAVSLDSKEIRAVLTSLNEGLATVNVDGSEHLFRLRRVAVQP